MLHQVYTSLAQAYEQASIDEVRNTPVMTVIEAVEEPVGPNPRRLALAGSARLVFGILSGPAGELVQRRHEAEGMQEVSELWSDTLIDLRRLMPGFRHAGSEDR